jgi:hypothetical protein
MTASEISPSPGEPLEMDGEELEQEGIARVIYVAPVAVTVEREARNGLTADG